MFQNPRVTEIYSAIEIDLTWQVCSYSIETCKYSGHGDQMEYICGAALSEGGKPIIALPSTTKHGLSEIMPYLKKGAGVVTTRGHLHWVVTEFGAVNLFGIIMDKRAKELIKPAQPEHREFLCKMAHGRLEY
ncbi:MAG: acetyl-CoA hydrolase/transferase C-terminal domain-containing protein [Bacteroidia bacterium]